MEGLGARTIGMDVKAESVLNFLKNYDKTVPGLLKDKNYYEIFSYIAEGSILLNEYFQKNKDWLMKNIFGIRMLSLTANLVALRDFTFKKEKISERQIQKTNDDVMVKLPEVIFGLEALINSKRTD